MVDKFRGLIENEDEKDWIYFSLKDFYNNEELLGLINKFTTITQSIGKTDSLKQDLYEGDVLSIERKDNKHKWLIEPIGETDVDGVYFGMVASPRGSGVNYFIDEGLLEGVKIGDIYIDGDSILSE